MKKLTEAQTDLLIRLENYGHIALIGEDYEEAVKFLSYAEPDYDSMAKDLKIEEEENE